MRTPLTAVIVLYSTCCAAVLGSCSRDWPDLCYVRFWGCSAWRHYTSGWLMYPYGPGANVNYYLGLKESHATTEEFESRKVCSTSNTVHCLYFHYAFEENFVLHLSVFIKRDGLGEEEVWRMSSSTYSDRWDNARVPVNSSTDFTLVFKASGSENKRVFIDNIFYVKQACDIQPTAAAIAPSTTTSTVTTETVPTPNFRATSTGKTFTTVLTTQHSFPTEDSEHRSDSTRAGDGSTTASQAGRTAAEESSSNIVLIVGVAVAVVLLLLIGLVLFLLFKRRQLHDWKVCFRKQKQKTEEDLHGSASHHPAAYSLDEIEPGQFFIVDTGPVSSQTDNQKQGHTAAVVPSPGNNPPSVVDATASDHPVEDYTYAEVNKPKKSTNAKSQQYHQGSDESPYEVQDLSENATTSVAGSPEDDFTRLNFHTRSHLAPKSTALPSTARREEPGLYQNSANTLQTPQQKASQSLYQNVGSAQRHRHQQGPGLTSLPEQGYDLTREDASADVYTLPSGTASTLQPFTEQEDPTLPEPHCLDEENNTYHVLEEAPSSSYRDTGDKAEADYSHLDLQRSRTTEVKDESEPAAVYSHLKEGEEGDYDRVDRGGRKDIIDGDYSHI